MRSEPKLLAGALAAVLAVVSLPVVGLPQSGPAREQVIVAAYPRDFRNLDPARIPGSPDYQIAMNVFNGLVRYKSSSLDVEPDLAERWTVSPDGKTYTFVLRRGVQFHHDYGEMTSADVKFSFDRILNPETKSPYRDSMQIIQSVDTPDKYTVRVVLNAPSSSFLAAVLAFRPGYIVSQRAVEQLGSKFSLNPIGTGAFQFASYAPRQEIVLDANAHYFRGAPAAKRIVWKIVPDDNTAALALRRGEINFMIVRDVQVYKDLQKDPSLAFTATPAAGWWGFYMNTRRKPLSDVKVRRALAYATDRETFVKALLEGVGQPIYSILSPGMVGYTANIERYPFNPARAKALVAEAGYPNGFKINVIHEESAYSSVIATAMQEWFKNIGVTLDDQRLEAGAWTARHQAGDYDINIDGITRFDPDQILTEEFHSVSFPPGSNYAYYGAIDALIEAQRRALTTRERVQILAAIQRKVAEDVPVVPIVDPIYVTAYNRGQHGYGANTGHWMTRFEFVKFAVR